MTISARHTIASGAVVRKKKARFKCTLRHTAESHSAQGERNQNARGAASRVRKVRFASRKIHTSVVLAVEVGHEVDTNTK